MRGWEIGGVLVSGRGKGYRLNVIGDKMWQRQINGCKANTKYPHRIPAIEQQPRSIKLINRSITQEYIMQSKNKKKLIISNKIPPQLITRCR